MISAWHVRLKQYYPENVTQEEVKGTRVLNNVQQLSEGTKVPVQVKVSPERSEEHRKDRQDKHSPDKWNDRDSKHRREPKSSESHGKKRSHHDENGEGRERKEARLDAHSKSDVKKSDERKRDKHREDRYREDKHSEKRDRERKEGREHHSSSSSSSKQHRDSKSDKSAKKDHHHHSVSPTKSYNNHKVEDASKTPPCAGIKVEKTKEETSSSSLVHKAESSLKEEDDKVSKSDNIEVKHSNECSTQVLPSKSDSDKFHTTTPANILEEIMAEMDFAPKPKEELPS
jgi:hypothetical protein